MKNEHSGLKMKLMQQSATKFRTKISTFTKNILLIFSFFVAFDTLAQPVFDADGNSYDTVTIGTQTWLTKNLLTTHFSNGDLIPTTIPVDLDITSEINPIYQWSFNGIDSLAAYYGRLYTGWVASDTRNVCPIYYHVPSIPEFNVLINYLGGSAIAGGKLKETGIEHWNAPNSDATNETGFTSVGNGHRNMIGEFNSFKSVSDTWSTTPGNNGAWDFDVHAENPTITSYDDSKGFGFAIRCVKNNPLSLDETSTKIEPIISIYPNPANQFLSVNSSCQNNLTYTILSIQGELIVQGQLFSGNNQIDLSQLAEGVYIIRCVDTINSITLKFIKTN